MSQRHGTTGATPWSALRPSARRATLSEFRRRCARLPPPGHIRLFEVDQPRMAALLIPVAEVAGDAALVVTKRSSAMRLHRNDWVFPGGRVEDGESSADAARREAAEELGLELPGVELLGQLNTRGPILTGYLLDVFVADVTAAGPLRPDPREVAEVAVLPLSVLTADASYEEWTTMPDHDPGPGLIGRSVAAPVHPLRAFAVRPGEWLWGLQADVVVELLGHVLAGTDDGSGDGPPPA